MTEAEWKDFRLAEQLVRKTYYAQLCSLGGMGIALTSIYLAFQPHQHLPEFALIVNVSTLVYWCFLLSETADHRRMFRQLIAAYIERDIWRSRERELLLAQREAASMHALHLTRVPSRSELWQ